MEAPFSPDLLDEIVLRIVKVVHPHRIYLFGSHGRGTATEDSDVDLVVIADSEESHHERSRRIHRLFPRRQFSMDVFMFTPKEFEAQQERINSIGHAVAREGKLLYERP